MRLSPLIRAFTLAVLFAAAGTFALAQTRQPDNRPRNCLISGRVTVGGNPVNNKIIIASEIPERSGVSTDGIDLSVSLIGMSSPAYSARTDADGRYRIINLPAGKYEVHPQAQAYVPEKKSGAQERTITLENGESEENVDFALVRGGVITGRVTDAEGHPLIEQQIEAALVAEDGQNRPYRGLPGIDTISTDDRGVYRIYGLPAGRYRVNTSGGGFGVFGPMASKHPRTYHPNVTEEAQARVVEVAEGGEVTEIDIRLGVARKTFEVVGRVIDAETGQPIPQASIICVATTAKDDALAGFNGTANSDAKGNFRFSGLQPGQYTLQLTPNFGAILGKQSEHYAEETKFEITASDVSGIEVQAKRGASISGFAVIETTPDQKGKINLAQMMLSATVTPLVEKSEDPGVAPSPHTPGFSFVKLNSDGSFRVTGLPPGRAMLRPFGISGSAPSVKRIEREGVEAPEGIEVRAGETVTGVKVVLAYASGMIRGQVNFAGGQLPAGWRIMAMAERSGASPSDRGGFANVDGKGRFVIEGLFDGEYTVTVHAISDTADPPPTAIQTVRIANGAEVQVTLTLDPGKKQEERR